MELAQLSERVYYLPGSVTTALIVGTENRAIVVDTGQDKDAGRRLKRACESLGLTPAFILNTHAHADHYGGNDFLLRNFEVQVYAPPFEASILQTPYLEPVYLFGGAKPPPELVTKWLMAKPSRVDQALEPGALELAGAALTVLDTSGHAHAQRAVLVDDVLLAADAVFGVSVLEKYPLPFGQDIGAQIQSAERVAAAGARAALPGHGEPTEDVSGLVEANLAAFARAADAVAAACTGVGADEVLAQTCGALGLTMTDLPRYHLNLCVVKAYLSYLREMGRVELELAGNRLQWRAL